MNNIIVTQAIQSLTAQVVQLAASVKSLEQRLNEDVVTQRDLDMAIAKACLSLSTKQEEIPPLVNTFSPVEAANAESSMSFLENVPEEDDIVINASQPKKKTVRRKNAHAT